PLPSSFPCTTLFRSLVFRAGAAQEPTSAAGLAQIAAEFIQPEAEADFWKTGVSVNGEADDDSTTFTSSGMSMYTDVIITALERVDRKSTRLNSSHVA